MTKILDATNQVSTPRLPSLDESRNSTIALDFNENRFGFPPAVRDKLNALSDESIRNYPCYDSVMRSLSEHLGVPRDWLLLTNGADEAIRLFFLLNAFSSSRKTTMVLPTPTFSMYDYNVMLFKTPVIRLPYTPDWQFPTKSLLECLATKTDIGLIMTVSPNNPLGTIIPEEELKTICDMAYTCQSESDRGPIVVVDETYALFSGISSIPLISLLSNLCVIGSFSKVYGMAGLRAGYIVASPTVINALRQFSLPFPVNTLAVEAIKTVICEKEWLIGIQEETRRQKQYLIDTLTELGVKARTSYANFILAYFGTNNASIGKALLSRGILIKTLDNYPMLEGFSRITVGTSEENRLVMNALSSILTDLRDMTKGETFA